MYRIIQEWWPDSATLPDKVSDLLELALNDAKLLNWSRYEMNAEVFHQSARQRKDNKCGVCLSLSEIQRQATHRLTTAIAHEYDSACLRISKYEI